MIATALVCSAVVAMLLLAWAFAEWTIRKDVADRERIHRERRAR